MPFYAPSTGGFYEMAIHGDAIPDDAVALTDEAYAALLLGQSAGQEITAGEGGVPELTDPPAQEIVPIRHIAPLAFRRRMSPEKRAAITLAAQSNAALRAFLDDLGAARVIELDHADTLAGVAAMVGAGLLTEEEGDALLADGETSEL